MADDVWVGTSGWNYDDWSPELYPPKLPRAKRRDVLRHASWHCDETQAVLREHQAAYVVMSGPKLPCNLWATAPFVYLRFHGPDAKKMYIGEYGDQAMAWWGERGREWLADGREVWAYSTTTTTPTGCVMPVGCAPS